MVLVFARKLSIFDEGHRVAAADNDYAAAAAERASETCLQYNLKQIIPFMANFFDGARSAFSIVLNHSTFFYHPRRNLLSNLI